MKRSLFAGLGLALLAVAAVAFAAVPVAALAAPDIGMAVASLASAVQSPEAAAGLMLAGATPAVNMRAKFAVSDVKVYENEGKTTGEQVSFSAVAKSGAYPADGSDDDNTFARWSLSASCTIHIANPALFGRFERGQKFYVDFTPAT